MVFLDKPVAQLLGSNGPVHALTYSSSPGTYILAGSADRTIRLYNPTSDASSSTSAASSTLLPQYSGHISKLSSSSASGPPISQGRLIQAYSAHGYEVLSLACSHSNEHFCSAGGDRTVFLWDVATATTLRRFGGTSHGHSSRVNAVSFAGEDDGLLISGGFDTTVRIWDVKAGSQKPVQVLDEAKDAITCLVVRGHEIVTGSVDGRVRSYDVRTGLVTADLIGASVTSLSLTRDGRAVLVSSLDSRLRLMDRDTGECLQTYKGEGFTNEELRVQSVLGGGERYVVSGDELATPKPKDGRSAGSEAMEGEGVETVKEGEGRVWAWDLLSGRLVVKVAVPWGPDGYEGKRRAIGRDGKEKERKNVTSAMAWKEDGWGDQFCVSGSSGVVTVYGSR